MTTDMRRLISLTNGVSEVLNENEGTPMSNFGKWGTDLKESAEPAEETSLEEEEMVDPEAEGLTDLDEEAEEDEMEELDEETMDELDEDVSMTPALDPQSMLDHIASLVEQGYTESHKPEFNLHIGDEVRGDEFAMEQIAAAIRSGETHGSYPHWTLSMGGIVDETSIYGAPRGGLGALGPLQGYNQSTAAQRAMYNQAKMDAENKVASPLDVPFTQAQQEVIAATRPEESGMDLRDVAKRPRIQPANGVGSKFDIRV